MLSGVHIEVASVVQGKDSLVVAGEWVWVGWLSHRRGVGEGSQVQSLTVGSTYRVRTIVSTHLDDTLEVDIHGVRELKGLEVSVGHNWCRGTKVLDLLELGHYLGPGDAAQLIHQLDGCPLAIMSHTVPHQHVKLVLIILDAHDHGHGLTNLDYTRHLTGPGTLANLDLHPTLEIVSKEVRSHSIDHINLEIYIGE